jgi:hypothetical protein
VKQHLGAVQQCYETALMSDPSLKGRVEYDWVINAAGRVTNVQVKKSEMSGGDALHGCVFRIFRAMKFPKATNGQETAPNIGFPFGQV